MQGTPDIFRNICRQSFNNEVNFHDTKFKEDIGLTKVIADLVVKGHVPCHACRYQNTNPTIWL